MGHRCLRKTNLPCYKRTPQLSQVTIAKSRSIKMSNLNSDKRRNKENEHDGDNDLPSGFREAYPDIGTTYCFVLRQKSEQEYERISNGDFGMHITGPIAAFPPKKTNPYSLTPSSEPDQQQDSPRTEEAKYAESEGYVPCRATLTYSELKAGFWCHYDPGNHQFKRFRLDDADDSDSEGEESSSQPKAKLRQDCDVEDESDGFVSAIGPKAKLRQYGIDKEYKNFDITQKTTAAMSPKGFLYGTTICDDKNRQFLFVEFTEGYHKPGEYHKTERHRKIFTRQLYGKRREDDEKIVWASDAELKRLGFNDEDFEKLIKS